ncbi:hypothetical protein [Hyphomonas sp.]|uniref:hypothetical protein n=1 Tax=Hyphomonas sp. TaxID=87 RepID=UPI0025C662A6|nr:hypothetical protein [Hyphomonas sp.]
MENLKPFFLDLLTNSLFWVVTIGGLTVFATLIAPRLGSRGKLGYEVISLIGLRLSRSHEKVSVQYTVDGNQVHEDIYVAELKIKNIGTRDISQDRFLSPVTFHFPDFCEILSIDCSGAADVQVRTLGKEKVCAEWSLLKRGESISISAVCMVPKSETLDRKNINFEARLVDVDDKPMTRPILAPLAVAYVVLFTILGSSLFLDNGVQSSIYFQGEHASGGVLFRPKSNKFKVCTERSSIFTFRDCEELPITNASLSNMTLQETVVGIDRGLFLAVVIGTFIYLIPPFLMLKFRDRRKFRSVLRRLFMIDGPRSSSEQ